MAEIAARNPCHTVRRAGLPTQRGHASSSNSSDSRRGRAKRQREEPGLSPSIPSRRRPCLLFRSRHVVAIAPLVLFRRGHGPVRLQFLAYEIPTAARVLASSTVARSPNFAVDTAASCNVLGFLSVARFSVRCDRLVDAPHPLGQGKAHAVDPALHGTNWTAATLRGCFIGFPIYQHGIEGLSVVG